MAQTFGQVHRLQPPQHTHQHHHHWQQQQMRQRHLPHLPLDASPISKEIRMDRCGGQMRANVPHATPPPSVTRTVVRTLGAVAEMPVPGFWPTFVIPATTTAVFSGDNTPTPAPNSDAAAITPSSSPLPSPPGSSSKPSQLSPLPEGAQPSPATTQATPDLLTDNLRIIPEISEGASKIQEWMKTDEEYEGMLKKMKERMTVEMRSMFGGTMWWEKGSPDVDVNQWKREGEDFEVRYPLIRREEKQEGNDRRTKQREGLRLPRKLEPEEANRPEELVPIRLGFDVEHHKLRDTFVWNLNDPVVTPEAFAQSIVDDYALTPIYHSVIVNSIQEQLNDYRTHSFNHGQDSGELVVGLKNKAPVLQGALDDPHAQWWEAWRKRTRTATSPTATGAARLKKKRKLNAPDPTVKVKGDEKNVVVFDVSTGDGEEFRRPMMVDEVKLDEKLMHEEKRILIKFDIIVGDMELKDQFEWDLESGTVTPEDFSEVYAQDLGLGGEFKTAIAHSIREQVQMYRKSLFLVRHRSDSTPIQDELRQAFLPSLTSGARPMGQVPYYTPVLDIVSDSDIQWSEKEREKEMNRKRKRHQRGRRGIVIPDREPLRTHRTPALGFPELDHAALALAATANTCGSRRAAAAAASLMIAKMIASENDTTCLAMSTQLPMAPKPQPTKEKKPKYLFKAPTVPSPVLRPRAQITAPTPSTAVDVVKLYALENGPPPVVPLPPQPLEPRMKVVPKRSTKELEQEAMEKEFADGQYPNWIDGIWYCSNCGCPESATLSRRRGPLGDKSQCELCGKFWHKHRRPRPVEYNPDPEFHTRKGSDSKTPAREKATVPRVQSTTALPESDRRIPTPFAGTPAQSTSLNETFEPSPCVSPGPDTYTQSQQSHGDWIEPGIASSVTPVPAGSPEPGQGRPKGEWITSDKISGNYSLGPDYEEREKEWREKEEKKWREKVKMERGWEWGEREERVWREREEREWREREWEWEREKERRWAEEEQRERERELKKRANGREEQRERERELRKRVNGSEGRGRARRGRRKKAY